MKMLFVLQEQHYISIFLNPLWSVHTALISNTQNSEIPGFKKYKIKHG